MLYAFERLDSNACILLFNLSSSVVCKPFLLNFRNSQNSQILSRISYFNEYQFVFSIEKERSSWIFFVHSWNFCQSFIHHFMTNCSETQRTVSHYINSFKRFVYGFQLTAPIFSSSFHILLNYSPFIWNQLLIQEMIMRLLQMKEFFSLKQLTLDAIYWTWFHLNCKLRFIIFFT